MIFMTSLWILIVFNETLAMEMCNENHQSKRIYDQNINAYNKLNGIAALTAPCSYQTYAVPNVNDLVFDAANNVLSFFPNDSSIDFATNTTLTTSNSNINYIKFHIQKMTDNIKCYTDEHISITDIIVNPLCNEFASYRNNHSFMCSSATIQRNPTGSMDSCALWMTVSVPYCNDNNNDNAISNIISYNLESMKYVLRTNIGLCGDNIYVFIVLCVGLSVIIYFVLSTHYLVALLMVVAMFVKVIDAENIMQKLLANGACGDFGCSVSIAPPFAIIGYKKAGSAYIYEKDNNGSWNEVSKLLASDGESGDNFGWSVGIAPPFAFISAYTDDNSNGDFAGSVYIYENDNKGSWNEVSKLIASDGAARDGFGCSVSIAPPFALIGAKNANNSNGIQAGSAYIYKLDNNGSWNEVSKLLASDGKAEDLFGTSVSIAPPFAIIGAYYNEAGSAYIYENNNNGSWNEVSKLLASDGDTGDNFGWSVSIAPPFAIIGANYDDNSNGIHAGSAYIYENDNNGSWNEVSKLITSDESAWQSFGQSVSIAPPFAIIGAFGDENSNGINAGSAYIYKNDNNGSWNEVSKLIANDGSQGDFFGSSVSIAPPFALIGGYKGPVYIMTSYESCANVWNEAPEKSKLIQTNNTYLINYTWESCEFTNYPTNNPSMPPTNNPSIPPTQSTNNPTTSPIATTTEEQRSICPQKSEGYFSVVFGVICVCIYLV